MATQVNTTARSIRFPANGKLKIMHITDTHIDTDNADLTLWLIEQACKREMPNIAVITGDNVTNKDDEKITKSFIDRLMKIFQNLSIPVAVTFGNHDSEVGALSREELMAYYNRYSCSLSIDDGDLLSGCGTYVVPVLSSDGNELKYNLWIFDSNDYDKEGHYGCVLKDQVEWYKQESDKITNSNNGKKVYSLAFQHMIVPEVYDVLKKTTKRKLYSFSHMYNKKDYYMFDPAQKNFGTFNETPCCGYENYGQFDAMVEKGDVLAIFTGHDHTNAFGVKNQGIDIVNSLSTRSNGDRFSTQYGYRIIEVNEKDTSVYSSRNERWYNFFSRDDVKNFKNSGDTFALKAAKSITRKGRIQKFYTKTGRAFTTLVTGRKVTYPD